MPRDDLTFLSYSVLVLVGRSGASPHDFVQMMRAGRVYQTASPSQYYAEPKRLEQLGYLTSTKEPGKTRERTVYRLTEKGLDGLRHWAHEPAAFPGVHGEPPIKMLAADLVGEAPVRASLVAMRAEMDSLRAELDLADDRAETIPHRAKYLHLNHRLSRRILDCYEEWLTDVERELG